MSDIVIASAARTPIGTFNGAFASLAAHDLGKVAIAAALERAGIKGEDVCELLVGDMKMRPMMRCAHLREHANDDSKEARNLWHVRTLTSSARSCLANAGVHQRRPMIAPAAVWCNAMLGCLSQS